MSGSQGPEKEESLLLLVSLLVQKYGQSPSRPLFQHQAEVEAVCAFIQDRYAEHISLDQLCRCAGLSRSTLLRAFTRAKGVTPYRYLENVRIGEAKKLLEQGISPVEAALLVGFSDQSHFTNYFDRFLGLSPGSYRDIFSETKK